MRTGDDDREVEKNFPERIRSSIFASYMSVLVVKVDISGVWETLTIGKIGLM